MSPPEGAPTDRERVTALLRGVDDDDGPVFAEPWQAQAFALAVQLNESGAFTWSDWAAALAAELERAGADQDGGDGSRYYECWLAALEALVTSRRLAERSELDERRAAWAQAYRDTPHGKPVELPEG